MKKESSHFMSIGSLLSRSEMKQVIAGSDPIEDGGCKQLGEECDTNAGIICCNPSKYVCASHVCQVRTA